MARKKKSERVELLWRILVAVVSGIILGLWRYLIFVVAIFHWFYVLFTGKRNRELGEFCEHWNGEMYRYMRYLTFEANDRPFPFTSVKAMGKYEK